MFELSYAYPFMSLSLVLVLGLSVPFLHEAITAPKIIGMTLIIAGIIIRGQGLRCVWPAKGGERCLYAISLLLREVMALHLVS